MNESTLIINKPFALKQKNGKPIYTEIKKPEDRIKEMEDKGIDKKHYKGCYEDYKEFLKTNVRDIKVNYEINIGQLERIVITPNAKGYISTYFLDFLQANKIPIYWIDGRGNIESSFMPTNFIKPSLAIKQYEAISKGKGIEIGKYLIGLKLESYNQIKTIPDLNKAKDIETILSIEGVASNKYFDMYKESIPKEWQWEGRRGKNNRNKNATDPINSFLNFGYSILVQRMSEVLLKRGFELSLGFIHISDTSKQYYWNRLSYDFIEPYRVWIDNSVKEMIEDKTIKPNDFIYTEDKKQLILKDKAIKIGIDGFTDILKPLEHRSLPIIRTVESML